MEIKLSQTNVSKTRWTAKELLQTKFPELDWIVPGLLPEGMTILGGRPKVGKSWLSMQIAKAVISGCEVFGKPVKQGKVFYLALEDNPRRLARRLTLQDWLKSTDCIFETDWKPLNDGGLEDLAKEFKKEQYRLCVVDTGSRAFKVKDHNDLSAMTKAYSMIQKFFESCQVSPLIIEHLSKMGNGSNEFDPIESVIASTAKVAVADTIIALARTRGQRETMLRSTGREMEELDTKIILNKETMLWELSDGSVKEGTLQDKILKYAREKESPIYVVELSKILGKDKAQVSKEFGELVVKGLLLEGQKQGTHIPYLLPTVNEIGFLLPTPSKKK